MDDVREETVESFSSNPVEVMDSLSSELLEASHTTGGRPEAGTSSASIS
jgi:hypothetical protein